jgi:hypothetical protein
MSEQNEPVRVLHIITRMIVGGAQENTLLSVVGLDAMPEYDVTLVSGIDKGKEGELLTQARQTAKLIVLPEMGRSINPFSDIVAFWKLYRLIKKGRYTIVHTHSSKAGVLGRLAAWLAGTPFRMSFPRRLSLPASRRRTNTAPSTAGWNSIGSSTRGST